MFPVIKTIYDLLPHIKDEELINSREIGHGCFHVSYVYQDSKLFKGDNAIYTRECRGITFNKSGEIVSRPFHKFHNLNETTGYLENDLNWNEVDSIQDKRDGSMISPVLIDKKIFWKTKKSFDNQEATLVNKLYHKDTKENDFAIHCLSLDYTPIFEFTSPYNRIVIGYKEPKLTLLAIRNLYTGEYLKYDLFKEVAEKFEIDIAQDYSYLTLDEIKQNVETGTGFEGYVITFKDGKKVKVKTNYYLALHRNVTFTTERQIAEMVLDDVIDDYKAYIQSLETEELSKRVDEIESQVIKELIELEKTCNDIIATDKDLSVKDFSLKWKSQKMFHLLIRGFRGNDMPFKDYYKMNYLEKFENIQI